MPNLIEYRVQTPSFLLVNLLIIFITTSVFEIIVERLGFIRNNGFLVPLYGPIQCKICKWIIK